MYPKNKKGIIGQSGFPGAQQSAQPGSFMHAQFPQHSTLPPQNRNTVPLMPDSGRGGKKPVRLIIIIIAVLFILFAGYFGINLLRDQQVTNSIAPYMDVYGPNIFINDIPLSSLRPQEALERLRESVQNRINSWKLSISYKGHIFITLDYGTLGLKISDEDLYPLLNEAWMLTHSGSIHEQKAAIDKLSSNTYRVSSAQNEMNGAELQTILEQIAPYVNRNPVDAAILAFQPDQEYPFTFQDEQQGAQLDIEEVKAKILSMAASSESGSLELTPEVLPPSITRAELEETVKLRTSIATSISASSTENRNHNIRVSFSKINGMILKPGQTFSFNDVVGPRTLKAGFSEALEYVYGDLVTGIGGGVCQASTTLYQAALTAGMTITKRTPHSDKVDYTEMGQDATVYLSNGREIDFKFMNSTPSNIYLTAHVKAARNNSKRLVAEIRIYGITLGDGVSYRLRSDVVQVIAPPDTKKLVVDLTGLIVTYKDEEKLKSRAQEGYVIETYLEKYVNGILAEQPKLISSDTFRAKQAEYWVGNTYREN